MINDFVIGDFTLFALLSGSMASLVVASLVTYHYWDLKRDAKKRDNKS
jgi:hypothetical protein